VVDELFLKNRPLDYTSRWQRRLKDAHRRLLTGGETQLRIIFYFETKDLHGFN
jgi:hypothetical protein